MENELTPARPRNLYRNKRIYFYMTAEERESFRTNVRRSGLTQQAYLLNLAMGKSVWLIEDLKPLYLLLKQSVNQLAADTATSPQNDLPGTDLQEIKTLLSDVYIAINQLCEAVNQSSNKKLASGPITEA